MTICINENRKDVLKILNVDNYIIGYYLECR